MLDLKIWKPKQKVRYRKAWLTTLDFDRSVQTDDHFTILVIVQTESVFNLVLKQDYLKKNVVLCHVLGHFLMFCFKCTSVLKQNNWELRPDFLEIHLLWVSECYSSTTLSPKPILFLWKTSPHKMIRQYPIGSYIPWNWWQIDFFVIFFWSDRLVTFF